jgi:hypothetical protein
MKRGMRVAIVLTLVLAVNSAACAEEWKVGACYKLEQDNPFSSPVELKVVAASGRYVQYRFFHDRVTGWGFLQSGGHPRDIFQEIPCPKSFFQEIVSRLKR